VSEVFVAVLPEEPCVRRRGGVTDEKREDGGLGQWFPVTSPPYSAWRVVSTQRGGLCPAITCGAVSKISL
jgi:hypothetical protein